MEQEKQLTERESLQLITSMINTAKKSYHETGLGLILWGCVITLCSLEKLAEIRFHYTLPFDIYLLTLAAIIPQIFITIKENRERQIKSHNDVVMDYLWLGFGISIFLLAHVNQAIYGGINELELNYQAVGLQHPAFRYSEYVSSFFLIIYGFPTFVTGAIMKFKPMLWGGICCWASSIVAVYTPIETDLLLTALSATFAWLLPGIILNSHYRHTKRQASLQHV